MFAHASAARVAASNTAALPVSVRTNRRKGVSRRRAHAVRGVNCRTADPGSATPGFSLASDQPMISEPAQAEEAQEAPVDGFARIIDAHPPCLDFVFGSAADGEAGGKEPVGGEAGVEVPALLPAPDEVAQAVD